MPEIPKDSLIVKLREGPARARTSAASRALESQQLPPRPLKRGNESDDPASVKKPRLVSSVFGGLERNLLTTEKADRLKLSQIK